MISMKKRRLAAIVTAATLALGGGVVAAAPAVAVTVSPMAVYTAGGSIVCPAGRDAYIRVTLNSPGTVTFYASRSRITTTYGNFHYETVRSTGKTIDWRIQSDTSIGQVSDGCN